MPVVQTGRPHFNKYFEKTIDHYTVYVQEGIKPADMDHGIVITTGGFWIFKTLEVLNVTHDHYGCTL